MIAWIGVILASFCIVVLARFYLIFRSYEPMVKKAMTIIGGIGHKSVQREGDIAEVEAAIKGGAIDMLTKKFPEFGLLMMYLEENHPDIKDKVTDNPELLYTLYEKYAPLINKFFGKGGGEKQIPYNV